MPSACGSATFGGAGAIEFAFFDLYLVGMLLNIGWGVALAFGIVGVGSLPSSLAAFGETNDSV